MAVMSVKRVVTRGVSILTLVIVVVCTALTAVAAAILAGGWLLNWRFPTISFQFASLIAGQAVLVASTLLLIGMYALVESTRSMRDQKANTEAVPSEDDDEDFDSGEELAERIAELTIVKLRQAVASERRYTTKPRRK